MLGVYRNSQNLTIGKWLITSTLFFFICIMSLTLMMMLANVGLINNIQFPVSDSLSLFTIMFEQNPWETIYIFSNKSLLAIGQFDDKSGLYLWTLELDFNSLVTYALACGIGTWLFRHVSTTSQYTSGPIYKWTVAGLLILIFSRTYVAVLGHCAGPTWIGYVALYGLGAEKLEITSTWQWFIAAIGFAFILVAVRKTISSSSSNLL